MIAHNMTKEQAIEKEKEIGFMSIPDMSTINNKIEAGV
jgi:hypothetical protein